LVHLHTLLLSANKIEYFEDLNEISQLPSLSKLSFDCENFGECPVSELENYREYVLNQLTPQQQENFQDFDSERVTMEEIQSAQKIFVDEMMHLQQQLQLGENQNRQE